MTPDIKEETLTLSNGLTVPLLGIGTSTTIGAYSHEAVVCAIKECGIRHIDTASMYRCEHLIAKAIKETGVSRKELFITSKVWPTQYGYDEVKKTVKKSLKKLSVDYIDLYLLHCPICPRGTKNPKELIAESWKALEECYQEGLCKAIGVSNFEVHHLTDLKETWAIVPHMNQIELHIYNYPKKLINFCYDLGIKITAYCPLARGKALKHPEVIKIAEEHNCTASQVLVKWGIQKGFVSIPKSTKPGRVREMAKFFQCQLSADNMSKLDEISIHEYLEVCVLTEEMVHKCGEGL